MENIYLKTEKLLIKNKVLEILKYFLSLIAIFLYFILVGWL